MFVQDFPEYNLAIVIVFVAFIALFMCICCIKFYLMPAARTAWHYSDSVGDVSFMEIVAMQFRGSNVSLILDVKVAYQKKGNPQTLRDLEEFYLANRSKVVDAEAFMAMYDRDSKKIE